MSLTHGLHRALQQQPNAIATVFGSRRRTYIELADRVARLAAALRTLGVRTEDRDPVAALDFSGGVYSSLLSARGVSTIFIPWRARSVIRP
jgi:long-chain acyl-CoA synthetase